MLIMNHFLRLIKPELNLLNVQKNFNQIFKRNVKVCVNGFNINYERVGNGNHKVILLPGALGCVSTDFGPQMTGLNRERLTVIGWDPPGFGYSRPPERDFHDFYRKDARLAAQLMKTLGFDKYSVLGWSVGGITGLILAAEFSQNVEKLVVWGSNAYVTEDDRQRLLKIKDINKWSEKAKENFIAVYGEEVFVKLWTTFVPIYVQLDDICKQDLKRIICPTFVLHGNLDPLVAEEHADYLVNNIKNAKLHRFPDGKHNIHMKYSKEFNQMIEKFLLN